MYNSLVKQINAYEPMFTGVSDVEIREKSDSLRAKAKEGAPLDSLLPEAYALVKEAAWRTLKMKHFNVQLVGGIALHKGKIAEMKTGEGKTLVATLPAYLNALTGKGVHIVTVNDYLAEYDAEQMGKVFKFLGLTVSCIKADTPMYMRKAAYACDIVYGTNKEFGFDYLRDNMVKAADQKMQRGYNFAIIDEADSILIDEARTPLIIASDTDDNMGSLFSKTDTFVHTLEKGIDNDSEFEPNDEQAFDYFLNEQKRTVILSDRGAQKAKDFFHLDSFNSERGILILHCINQSLRANNLMHEGKDYIVKKGEVIIIDNFTGRIMEGRRYNDGLHQAIEAKEHVKVQSETKVHATTTLQNYFRMYDKLSGMTGTAATERKEFKSTYRLDVVVVPTNKPVIRKDYKDILFPSKEEKFKAIAGEVKMRSAAGQPVLVGTTSVKDSETLSKYFSQLGIKHNVLNAKEVEKEAMIVAQAGKSGTVTIATNMAGRGTDILLGGNPEYLAVGEMVEHGIEKEDALMASSIFPTEDVKILALRNMYNELYNKYKKKTDEDHKRVVACGGLLVIGTERSETIRVDNQLRGRSGRQGDPGASQFYLSLDDHLIDLYSFLSEKSDLKAKSSLRMVRSAQKRLEAQNFEIRKNVLEYDDIVNYQREDFYKFRDNILTSDTLTDTVDGLIPIISDRVVKRNMDDKNHITQGTILYINRYLKHVFGADTKELTDYSKVPGIVTKDVEDIIRKKVEEKKELLGSKANDLARYVFLGYADSCWIDHLENIEALKNATNMGFYGNTQPSDLFKMRVSAVFRDMFKNLEEDLVCAFVNIKYTPVKKVTGITEKEQKDIEKLIHESAMDALKNDGTVDYNKIDAAIADLAKENA